MAIHVILGERVCDISFWKQELVNEMRAMDQEIDDLERQVEEAATNLRLAKESRQVCRF